MAGVMWWRTTPVAARIVATAFVAESLVWEAKYGQESSVHGRADRRSQPHGHRAGCQRRRRGGIEGDGCGPAEDDSGDRLRHGVRIRSGVQPKLAMARMEDEERDAHDRL